VERGLRRGNIKGYQRGDCLYGARGRLHKTQEVEAWGGKGKNAVGAARFGVDRDVEVDSQEKEGRAETVN